MREIWRRIREAFEESMRQQITALGFVFTLTVVLVGFAAFVSGNNLLFLLLAALLSTLLISGFVSRLGLAGLELDVQLPAHVVARRETPGHYQDPESEVPDALFFAASERRAGNRSPRGYVHSPRSGGRDGTETAPLYFKNEANTRTRPSGSRRAFLLALPIAVPTSDWKSRSLSIHRSIRSRASNFCSRVSRAICKHISADADTTFTESAPMSPMSRQDMSIGGRRRTR